MKLQIAIALEVIKQLDTAMVGRVLSDAERELSMCLKKKLLGLSSLERTIARQRSWILQLHEGDDNTRLFHQHASRRQRNNAIRVVKHNGNLYAG